MGIHADGVAQLHDAFIVLQKHTSGWPTNVHTLDVPTENIFISDFRFVKVSSRLWRAESYRFFFFSHPCSCSCLLCAQILILWFTYRLIWASCTVHATTCQYARTAYCHLPCKIKCERQTWKWKKEDRIRERERRKAAWEGTGIRGRWKIHKQNILKQLME